jgi:hypothetical protein
MTARPRRPCARPCAFPPYSPLSSAPGPHTPGSQPPDVKPLPAAVARGLTIHYVSRFEEVAKLAFPSRF